MNDAPQYTVTWRLSKRQTRKHPGSFANRQAARQWCRNHYATIGAQELTIVHPDGQREIWTPSAY